MSWAKIYLDSHLKAEKSRFIFIFIIFSKVFSAKTERGFPVSTIDRDKVEALKISIAEVGLLEPIDVLEVDGQIYGFSGCHRYQAHEEMGKPTIKCRVHKATKQVLRYHMM